MLQETIHTTDCSGKLVEKSVYEAVDALPNFDIGHAKSSQTKSFSCFIPPQGGSKKTTVYVDTPGFEDTDNQEIDIATSVMLSHIAKKCKTLKFIVLINYTSLLEDRGGAARSILRFTRAFVKDFGKDKKSFMFLFTHTNEIRGISNSLDSARKALQDEVLRLIDGTSKNDTDLLSLLDFMKKSLEKGYPFVDVLHPMDTDFLRLKTMIESKISPIKEPTLATNCGLTGPSRHKLSGEINGVLLRTRKHLQANPPDVQSVLENQKTLEYLGKHIDLGDVQRAAEDGKSLIDQYIQECRTSIEEGVSKGAVCDYDFGYRNAEDLQAALTRLDQLGAANLTHYLRKMIMSTVSEIQLSILRCDDSRLSWDARNLNKLRSWCKAFHDHEFAAIYPEVLAHLQSDIQNCVNAVGEFECHTEVQEEALSIHIDNVCCLDSVLTQLDQLSDHDMDFDAMNQAKKRALGTIYVLLSSCREEASDSMKTDTLDEDAMKTLLSRLSFIETLQSVLNAKGAFADLSYDACQLSEDLQRNVSLQFEESCNDIRKGNVYGFRGPLEKMRAVFETFDCIHGPEASRVRHNYQNLVDTIFASFKSAADSLLVESQSVSTDGIVNGNEAGVALNRLSEQSWFDEFLPPERCLIQDTCQKIQLEYEGRCKKIQLEALNILGKMKCSGKRKRNQKPWSRSTGSVEALRALKCIYDEFAEIESFALVTVNESIQADCCKVRSEILYHAEKIMNAAKSCVGNWKSASTETPSKALMSRLNTFLEEIGLTESLTNDTWCQNELASTEALVLSKFRSFSDEASKVFNSKTDFVNMARCLDIISDGDKNANIRLYLPSLASAKEQARSAVIQHAQEIQKLVAGTSEWDKIDMHLKELESAMVLDSYLSGEVELLLKPLCALRDRKETYVDSEIEEMIRSEDFQAISKFLAPLAVSADQLKRQKFHRYLRDIHNSLQSRIGQSTNFLPGGLPLNTVTKKIVENVGKLEDAQKELGEYLKDELPLSREIEKLKFRLNEKLRRVLDRMETDIQEKNLVRLATGREEIMTFVQVTRRYVDSKSLSRHRQIRKQYDQTLSSVPELVDAFFASLFQDGKDLLDILSSLKQASLSGSAEKKKMTTIYNETKQLLDKRLREYLKELELMVDYNSCYEDAISTLISLKRYSDLGLQDHVGEWIVFEMKELLDSCLKKQREVNRTFNFVGPNADTNRTSLAANLDKLDPSEKSWFAFWNRGKEYKSQCKKAEESVLDLYSKGLSALQSRNFSVLEEYIQTLCQLDQQVHKHVKNIDAKVTDLETRARDLFLDVCKQLKDALLGKSGFQYRSLFADFRSFVLEVASVFDSKECKKAYSLTNQLFYEKLQKEVAQLKEELELTNNSFDFSEIKSKVENVRILGEFVADHYTLFFEEVKNCDHIQADSWLKKIAEVCHEHFSAGRDFGKMKYYVQLGVVPSSSQDKIRREYMIMAKRYHPDKVAVQGEETNARFRAIREAWEALENPNQSPVSTKARPFDAMVRSIGQRLQKITQEHLKHQKYEIVVKLLFQLSSIRELEDLVSPRLDSKHIQSSVTNLVKGHVEQVRISVKSHWSERKYRELNEDIDDLKRMEKHFKTYSEIFPDSWNDGIVKMVENEIQDLGKQARACLASKQTAKDGKDDFRSLFLRMGFVLVELPTFKHATKDTMSSVLESCLDTDWGYSYLFELGLSLQKGDDSREDENRVAQLVLSEFSHFKEVMTMVWNEETIQKPVEDTVRDIKGYRRPQSERGNPKELDIESDELLDSFRVFEGKYKSLLGEYLKTGTDLTSLVRKTTEVADQIKPLTCDEGWTPEVKRVIPDIFAGVFALFTVLKSGESYNRLESSAEASEIGEKLLMKPHNIQVLTLLCMFGCGQLSQESLESQLMQIRTGEGKSMILGAAATVLGLLGFRVRCVCYSDYLSRRDYRLFEDVFDRFQIKDSIKYSKITSLSEDTTAKKGDIRYLTESLLHGNIAHKSPPKNEARGNDFLGADSLEPVVKGQVSEEQMQLNAKLRKTDLGKTSSPSESNTQVPVLQQHGYRTRSRASLESKDQIQPREAKNSGFWSIAKDSSPLPVAFSTTGKSSEEEVLLVDEVDVFFGSEFYGQTYNQVAQLREPEVAEILKTIWTAHKAGGRRPRLSDLQKTPVYHDLMQKIPEFGFLLDNEIAMMLNHVRRVEDEPYKLDLVKQRIGYKVMDSISYEVTYGYRTVFAYLREYDSGNVNDETLERVLSMPISCGQFSYADIRPKRILGVSGTLDVMSQYEKDVLTNYGVNTFLFVPSVYGESNFVFDEAGNGISIESTKSNFYHKICDEINKVTKQKRSVIVFFHDRSGIDDFTSSPFYQKLGRQKKVLSEDMPPAEKDNVINLAATAGQITICPAVFGRGTDFFCKDGKVEDNGGVHVIQTFLSEERSEEVQIQGRTARQGKQGSYKLVLLEDDLVHTYGLRAGEKDNVPKTEWYKWLCKARDRHREEYSKKVEANLAAATKKDKNTHKYFDALLASNKSRAATLFKEIYLAMKTSIPSTVVIDLSFAIDVTGSMSPFSRSIASTSKNLLQGANSIAEKLKKRFPEMTFKIRVGVLGFRDIDDKANQFQESSFLDGCHFTENTNDALTLIQNMTSNSSGGCDLAEDSLGAIDRCLKWKESDDWTGTIKCLVLLTDAPAHGFAPMEYDKILNGDSYNVRHPSGLTAEGIVGDLISNDVDLFFCSCRPAATSRTEVTFAKLYLDHPDNAKEREMVSIPVVPIEQSLGADALAAAVASKHIIFVLDESGSMVNCWAGVVTAYQNYLTVRLESQSCLDLVSVVQFSSSARQTVDRQAISTAPRDLGFGGGLTCFSPAASLASQAVQMTQSSHIPVVVFMSDGGTGQEDSAYASQIFSQLSTEVLSRFKSDLELHVIAFGGGADTRQLSDITRASKIGRLHASADTAALSQIFVDIAGGQEVASLLESQIGKRISETVADKLSLEYFA